MQLAGRNAVVVVVAWGGLFCALPHLLFCSFFVWQRSGLPRPFADNMAASSSSVVAPVVAGAGAVAVTLPSKQTICNIKREVLKRESGRGTPMSDEVRAQKLAQLEGFADALPPKQAAVIREFIAQQAETRRVVVAEAVETRKVVADEAASVVQKVTAHMDKTLHPAMTAGVPLPQADGESFADYRQRLDMSAMHVRRAKVELTAKEQAAKKEAHAAARAVAKAAAVDKQRQKRAASADANAAPPRAKAKAKAVPAAAAPVVAEPPVQPPVQQQPVQQQPVQQPVVAEPPAQQPDAVADDAVADDAHSQHSSRSNSS